MLFIDLALHAVLQERYPRPAVIIGRLIRYTQTVFKIPDVLFVDIRARMRFFLTVLHPRKRGFQIDVKVNDEIGSGKFQLYILKIIQPVKKGLELLVFELRALMHGV